MKTISMFAGLGLLLMPLGAPASDFEAFLDNLDERQIWQIPSGTMSIELRPAILEIFDIEVYQHGLKIEHSQPLTVRIVQNGSLSFLAPYGNFERFHQGSLELVTGLEIRYQGRSIDLNRASLVPARFEGQPGLALLDDHGRNIMNLTHFHVLAHPAQHRLEIKNADMYPTEEFERLLQFPDHTALFLGAAAFELDVDIPAGADVSQQAPRCSDPTWPQEGPAADVSLIAISFIQQTGGTSTTPAGEIKVTPSATLKNVGQADIPWVPKFGQIAQYQYKPRDQHPYLLWAMYRIHDGRIEMLANSGAKHAWLTVNTACPCAGGNILWPDCEDVYGVSINDNGNDLGPRSDIEASLGLFETCGSFFDPGCQGFQSNGSGSGFENRLVVHPDEFQLPGAQYFFDSWYLVQYDVNIWNTMGYRPINPTPSGGGWVFSPGPFKNGPPIGEWVSESDTDPMADHQVIVVPSATPDEPYPGNMPQGHLRLLVRVEEVDSGIYRYNYAVQNFDFERGVKSFSIPVSDSLTVSDTWFGGVGEMDDWDVVIGDGKVEFTAPEGEFLPWFSLFNFEIEVNAAPVEQQLSLGLSDGASVPVAAVEALGPPGTARLLSLDRSTIDFGEVAVGDTSGEEVAVLENSGDLLVSIAGIDQPATPFSAAGSCPTVSFELLPGDSCTLAYQFAPTTSGAFDQLLAISSDATNGPHEVALSGQAFAQGLEISPDQISFGNVIVGEIATESIELLNTGDMALSVGPIEIPASPFQVDFSDCGGTEFELDIDESCTLTIDFQPLESGDHADELLIHFDAPDSPTGVALTGNGLAHQLTVDPEDVAFGNVVVGQSHTIAVALINDSDLPIAVSSMDLPQDFFDVDFGDCESGTFELAVGGSCTMFVQFEPDALGIFADQIIIHSDVPDSPATIPLTGEGVEPALFEDRFEVIGVFGNWWSVSLRE